MRPPRAANCPGLGTKPQDGGSLPASMRRAQETFPGRGDSDFGQGTGSQAAYEGRQNNGRPGQRSPGHTIAGTQRPRAHVTTRPRLVSGRRGASSPSGQSPRIWRVHRPAGPRPQLIRPFKFCQPTAGSSAHPCPKAGNSKETPMNFNQLKYLCYEQLPAKQLSPEQISELAHMRYVGRTWTTHE